MREFESLEERTETIRKSVPEKDAYVHGSVETVRCGQNGHELPVPVIMTGFEHGLAAFPCPECGRGINFYCYAWLDPRKGWIRPADRTNIDSRIEG